MLGFDTHIFQEKKLAFEHNFTFYRFILFPCLIIALFAGPIKGIHNCKDSQHSSFTAIDYANCFCWLVYAFKDCEIILSQNLVEFFLPVIFFLFVVLRQKSVYDWSQLLLQDVNLNLLKNLRV